MIIDKVENLSSYAREIPWMAEIQRFLQSSDLTLDRYEIADGMVGTVGMSALRQEGQYEAHRRHIDFQLVLQGGEAMEWIPVDALRSEGPYDAERDVVFYEDARVQGTQFAVSAGWFAVFYPHDAHKPSLRWRDESCRKLVVKIEVDHSAE